GHSLKSLNRPTLLKKYLAADAAGRLIRLCVISPETLNTLLLAHNQMCVRARLCEESEGRERRFTSRFDERRVAYQGYAFKTATTIAAGMKASTIKLALQPVIIYVTGHDDGVKGALC